MPLLISIKLPSPCFASWECAGSAQLTSHLRALASRYGKGKDAVGKAVGEREKGHCAVTSAHNLFVGCVNSRSSAGPWHSALAAPSHTRRAMQTGFIAAPQQCSTSPANKNHQLIVPGKPKGRMAADGLLAFPPPEERVSGRKSGTSRM